MLWYSMFSSDRVIAPFGFPAASWASGLVAGSFEQALRISPSYAKPYYYLGVLSFKRKDYKRALTFLEQAETYSYGDDFWLSQVLLHEGLCLKALNLTATAKQKFQMAIQKDPTNEWAQQELKQLEHR